MSTKEERDNNKNLAVFALFLGIVTLVLSIFALYRTGLTVDEDIRVEVERALEEAERRSSQAGQRTQEAGQEVIRETEEALQGASETAEDVIPDDIDVQIEEDRN